MPSALSQFTNPTVSRVAEAKSYSIVNDPCVSSSVRWDAPYSNTQGRLATAECIARNDRDVGHTFRAIRARESAC
ncbi:hypothetical protein DACRYDRAFT_21355 [Dacryopinax primogenitus]|uniref:Uncharacterized protein n=1 Tax=Dacryopinax primogenitus (strain DJM 731) TaxID=1858805 RepID=M5FY52_DACPD|nr:uncharacterized protein DACRYDRAFT_21355 [Dacryopinax primogenitus]EJU02991.1 hypothetical protein DACRYDRAFT_21355 [Dacryopinax primogenitus]